MLTTLRTSLLRLLVPGLVSLLVGCATTQMNAEWRDATFAAATLKGHRFVVLCRSNDDTLRRVCEDQWADRLGAQGVVPVRSYSIGGFPWASADSSAEMRAALRANGAAALATMSLALSDVAMVNSGPQIGVGVGGGSGGGYRGGGFSFGGIGFSVPLGGGTVTQGLHAASTLVDVASGKLVWSGNASAPASSDVPGQVSALTQITTEALRKAGLI